MSGTRLLSVSRHIVIIITVITIIVIIVIIRNVLYVFLLYQYVPVANTSQYSCKPCCMWCLLLYSSGVMYTSQ